MRIGPSASLLLIALMGATPFSGCTRTPERRQNAAVSSFQVAQPAANPMTKAAPCLVAGSGPLKPAMTSSGKCPGQTSPGAVIYAKGKKKTAIQHFRPPAAR